MIFLSVALLSLLLIFFFFPSGIIFLLPEEIHLLLPIVRVLCCLVMNYLRFSLPEISILPPFIHWIFNFWLEIISFQCIENVLSSSGFSSKVMNFSLWWFLSFSLWILFWALLLWTCVNVVLFVCSLFDILVRLESVACYFSLV